MIRALAVGVLASLAVGSAGWQRAAPLPLARSEVAAAPYGSGILVVGGTVVGGSGNTARADLYLPARNRWRDHGPEALRRRGFAGARPAQAMLILDLRSGRWSAAPGPTPRHHVAVAAVGGRIYAVGGETEPGPGRVVGTRRAQLDAASSDLHASSRARRDRS